MMENTVFMELLRTGYQVRTGRHDNPEIDFTATKDGRRVYIQVTYSIGEEYNMERELRPFKGPKDHYRRILITGDRTRKEVLGTV